MEFQKPKVSVIIPVYNVEPYLRECLDSVVNQTLSDIEIICVDDGSTDGSPEILEAYKQIDPRFSVLHQANSGPSAARNLGLQKAKGEYLCFLDSDDKLTPSALEELYFTAHGQQLDFVAFDAFPQFETDALRQGFSNWNTYYSRARTNHAVYTGLELMRILYKRREYRASICLMLLRTDYLSKHQLAFFPGILHEDNLFSFLCYLNATRTMHLNEPYYCRRVREGSIMTKPETERNLHGYYICFVEMLHAVSLRTFSDQEEACAVKTTILAMWNSVQRLQKKLTQEQLAQLVASPYVNEQIMFDLYLKVFPPDKQKHPPVPPAQAAAPAVTAARQQPVYKEELDRVRASASYRIGRMITFLPRKLRGGLRCYRENGLRYTLRRLKEKLMR